MAEDLLQDALEFARGVHHTNLATCDDIQPHVRLMHWVKIEDDFTVWLSTRASSNKARHIAGNPKVCTIFVAEPGYVRVFGTAEIVKDQALKDEMWKEEWEMYWPDSSDPDYILLKIHPETVDYLNMGTGDTLPRKVF